MNRRDGDLNACPATTTPPLRAQVIGDSNDKCFCLTGCRRPTRRSEIIRS